jgi:hypothetical protein
LAFCNNICTNEAHEAVDRLFDLWSEADSPRMHFDPLLTLDVFVVTHVNEKSYAAAYEEKMMRIDHEQNEY